MKKLTEEFNQVSVAKGETFAIELDSHPSTGYGWDVKLKAGKASLVKEDFISSAPPDSMVCGAGGKEIFIFKAEETGTIEIEAQYKRSWENKPPLKLQGFSITVK
jgi:inhibitor of cysteine peptidase